MSQFFDGDAVAVSKYFKRFKRLHDDFFSSIMMIRGDNVLVERLPPLEVKTKSGLIIAEAKTHKNTVQDTCTEFGLVLATGPGQVFEDGTLAPCDAKPGDVVLLPQGTFWYGAFGHIADYTPYTIGRLRDGQIPIWFGDYMKAFEVLNG